LVYQENKKYPQEEKKENGFSKRKLEETPCTKYKMKIYINETEGNSTSRISGK
jgi:hypothetical protein